ncbi:MAG: AMP nucleosidase [Alphaproteobacteria bacterium]|nr:AMP nucleosidase [Alphaproteobacteria bacterium]HCQ70729.1 AMP nucleosidase [Rhodospirillaceae bacterium]|tara:strand:+ start:42052 stop:43494 length:1443 start_codon:yes stop_codon:yes gene_type:complete
MKLSSDTPPKSFRPKKFKTPDKAISYISEIYQAQVEYLRAQFDAFTRGDLPDVKSPKKMHGYYPYLRIKTEFAKRDDIRRSYGFAPKPGIYSTTLTRPDLYAHYWDEQLTLLLQNHDIPLEVGVSDTPIPVHFALGEDFHPEKNLGVEQIGRVPHYFDVPDLDLMNDEIPNSMHILRQDQELPLALFTAPRADLSLQRLKHYTGTSPLDFQNYVIFTNYQFYIDEFVEIGRRQSGTNGYTDFVMPDAGGRLPQMPAYHLKRDGNEGITMVNIGVGPSNAKTITDHIAVLRPHVWLMLGHCAGLRNSQKLGDYVLAHGYLREDHILDDDLPTSIPIPPLAEVQKSLEEAVARVTGNTGYDLKSIMRTGTVATTDDRNWELHTSDRQNLRLSQSRAIAMDMESGTIAANGFRFRVPYGTLLCVSDKPLHGQLKLPGMANSFYRQQVEQHLQVGLETMEILREAGADKLHSRKLRSFSEVAFR